MNVLSKLGMGMMRLPQVEGQIDLETTCRMVDEFLAAGGRWFDTAWGYHNGKSEPAVKSAVVDRHPRESFYLATKLPVWLVKSPEDPERLLQQQLSRTGVAYFDRYLLHALGEERLASLDENGVWDFLKSVKARGLAKSIGFSFHDTAEVLEKILSAHPEAEFVQLQVNYLDWEDDQVQARKCCEVARAHGVGIVVMEPVKGGMLGKLPEKAAAPLRALHPDWSESRWALSFCLSLEGVLTILSGMSAPEHVQDNLSTFQNYEPLGEAERAAIAETVAILNSMPSIPCTGCSYCVDNCPQHINIPGVFEAGTRTMRFGPVPAATGHYEWILSNGSGRASDCISCHACEANCPQHLEIASLMAHCAALLDR
jgi:predicted aldo/keto reductase-like oxidoreductase